MKWKTIIMSAWKKELSVGNKILDSEHRNLLDIVGKISHLIAVREITALLEVFELLESRLYGYFAVEEKIAQAVNFDFTGHKFAHQYLLARVERIKNKLLTSNGSWSDEEGRNYANSLMYCFTTHIKEDGKPLKIVLDTYLYDFNP